MNNIIKKGLIVGFANLIVGIVLSFGFQTLFPALKTEYQNPTLFRPWQDPLMMVFFAYPFIFGIVSAYFWSLIAKHFTGSPSKKAINPSEYDFFILIQSLLKYIY